MQTARKYKIAVVQLTRIGDVIQTYQAAAQLKKERADVELTLVARKTFAQGLEFLLAKVFDHITYLDVRDFIPSKNVSLEKSQERIQGFVNDINKLELDVLVNLSFCKSSAYLCSLIRAPHKMGIRRNDKNEIVINDKWSQFVYSSVMNSTLSPFNLVDVYKFMLGAQSVQPNRIEKKRENILVIHPFASSKKKSWGTSRWIDFTYKFMKDNSNVDVYIVGGKADKQDAERISKSSALQSFESRIYNCAGDFSIEDTYKLLERAKLLACHDSMVSHLAAVAQTPTMVISLGTVRPPETTSYQHNVLNFAPRRKCFPCLPSESCDLLPCHKDIPHQLISSVATGIFNEKNLDKSFFNEFISPFHMQNVSIFAPNFDESGMELIDITESEPTTADVFRTIYRVAWSFYLRSVEVGRKIPNMTGESRASLHAHIKGAQHIFELYQFGMKYTNAILVELEKKTPNLQAMKDNIQRLSEIDQLCAMTKRNNPFLKPLVDFFFVNKANALGSDLKEITQNNLLSFFDAQSLVQITYELMNKIVVSHERPSQAIIKDV